MISTLFNSWYVFYSPAHDLFWWIFHVHLERMCNLQLLNIAFYSCNYFKSKTWRYRAWPPRVQPSRACHCLSHSEQLLQSHRMGKMGLLYWPEQVADTDWQGYLDTDTHSHLEQEIQRYTLIERCTGTDK